MPSTNKLSDFKEGHSVVYVPKNKQANMTHDDCVAGVVSSVNDTFVFVKYYDKRGQLETTAQATSPEDLWFRI